LVKKELHGLAHIDRHTEIETLRKSLKEDEKRCEAKAKRLAENKSPSALFNKNGKK
jgi:hypothetical protein